MKRASTFFGRIVLTDKENNTVLLTNTDKLFFSVMEKCCDNTGNHVIDKTITVDREFEGGYGFELTPEETDIPEGTYYYDIGVQRENGEFYHVCMPNEFIIYPSVTRKDD